MRDLEKQLAEMMKTDRAFQASVDMVKRIEATANIGRQIHDLAMSAATSAKSLQDQIDRTEAWQKNMVQAEKLLRSTSSAESLLRPSWAFVHRDRVGVHSAMEAFLQSERPLRQAMADLEKRRNLNEMIQEREATARAVERQMRVLRNAKVHQLDLGLGINAGLSEPIAKPLVVDVEKNLEAIRQTKVDQEDFLRTYEPREVPEAVNEPAEPVTPPIVYGEHMKGFVDAIFTAQDIERVFDPFVTDYRMEMDAAAGDPEKMLQIQAEYRKQFILAVLGAAWAAFCRLFNALRRS